MIFDDKNTMPFDSYVTVKSQVFNADVYIELPTEEIFSFSDCVAIFFILDADNLPNRKYIQYLYFKTFSNKELKETNLKGFNPFGVYLFFKDELFLESFKATNKFIG